MHLTNLSRLASTQPLVVSVILIVLLQHPQLVSISRVVALLKLSAQLVMLKEKSC